MRLMLSVLAFSWLATHAHASSPKHVEYDVFVLPKLSMSWDATISLRYNYTRSISSRVFFTRETYALTDELDGFPESRREEETTETILDIYFIEYSLESLEGRLRTSFGLSLDVFAQGTQESAAFKFNGDQRSTNEYDAIFYSGKVAMQNELVLQESRFAVFHHIEYVPFYLYSFKQTMDISPLVASGPRTHAYRGTSYPYLRNELQMTFRYVELRGIHEYQQIDFELLNLVDDSSGGYEFVPKAESFYISDLTLLLCARIPITETLDVIVGAGVKLEKTHNRDTERSTRDRSQLVFELGVSDALFN